MERRLPIYLVSHGPIPHNLSHISLKRPSREQVQIVNKTPTTVVGKRNILALSEQVVVNL